MLNGGFTASKWSVWISRCVCAGRPPVVSVRTRLSDASHVERDVHVVSTRLLYVAQLGMQLDRAASVDERLISEFLYYCSTFISMQPNF